MSIRWKSIWKQLTPEFCDKFKSLSEQQSGYEQRAKVLLKRFAETETQADPPELPGVWESISHLEKLSDFIGEGDTYQREFVEPLDEASELLREEHARILGIRQRPGQPNPNRRLILRSTESARQSHHVS